MKGALAKLAALIQSTIGMTVPPERETALRMAISRVTPGLEPEGFLLATADPEYGPGLLDRLIDEITVHETSFARDMPQLRTIDWLALRRAARSAGSETIRVWSAGCATGEEAYTLAILAIGAFAPGPPPIDILGTDISGAVIAAAEIGRYRPRAVRDLEPQLRQRYLAEQPDGTYLIAPHLRGMARFRRHNLVHDPFPPAGEAAFDLVICRNVLIYFEPELARQVAGQLNGALRGGGKAILGAADVLQVTNARSGEFRPDQAGPVRGANLATAPEATRDWSRAPAREPARTPARAPARLQATDPAPARERERAPAAGPAGGPVRPLPGGPAPGEAAEAGGTRDEWLAAILTAAAAGDRSGALDHAASFVDAHPLDADAHFVHGLVALEAGQPAQARDALRQALCVDPGYSLAAFTLGRAYDALGDDLAARRVYRQALRTLDPNDNRHESMLQQVNLADIAAACRARLAAGQ